MPMVKGLEQLDVQKYALINKNLNIVCKVRRLKGHSICNVSHHKLFLADVKTSRYILYDVTNIRHDLELFGKKVEVSMRLKL